MNLGRSLEGRCRTDSCSGCLSRSQGSLAALLTSAEFHRQIPMLQGGPSVCTSIDPSPVSATDRQDLLAALLIHSYSLQWVLRPQPGWLDEAHTEPHDRPV